VAGRTPHDKTNGAIARRLLPFDCGGAQAQSTANGPFGCYDLRFRAIRERWYTNWREAQFSDNSCVRSQIQARNPDAPCSAKPGKSPVLPPDSIHFTPGNPIGVVAGLTWFF
jgi:hypothetical protein